MPIALMLFQILQGISLDTPQPNGERGRGYRSSSCYLEGVALYGGFAEIVSRIAA